jgi:TrmH family RNA methyltransferase
MKTVASRDNAAYKSLARLATSGSQRKRAGVSLLDGAHLLAAFLDSGRTAEEVVVNRAGLEDPQIARLVERCAPARVTLLSDALFKSVSSVDSPTGVLACVKTPAGQPVPDDAALVLFLENVQDPGNVGTLLRSAAAAGAGHVLLSPTCAFAWSPKVLRAGMGAHFAVNVVEGAQAAEFLARYRGATVALAGDAPASLYDLDLRGPTAFFVGNEGAGLSEDVRRAAMVRARIPMPGRVESLNAGTAGSICLFEAVRQRAASSKQERR